MLSPMDLQWTPEERCFRSRQCWSPPPAALGVSRGPQETFSAPVQPDDAGGLWTMGWTWVARWEDWKTAIPRGRHFPFCQKNDSSRVSISLLKLPSFIPWEIFSVLCYFTLFITFHFFSSSQPLGFQSHGVALFCQCHPAERCISPAW